MTISIWLYKKDGKNVLTPPKSSLDSEKLCKVLNMVRGYGMTISMVFSSLLGSHNPQPIPISISAETVLWYVCMSTISPCHTWRLLPKPRLKSKRNSQRHIWSQTSARHANSSASRYTAMVPGSVSVRKPISPHSSDDFGMEHTHSVLTPMDPKVKLDLAKDWVEKELDDITCYQAVVGSLMYTALATWPDISYAVAALSRYNLRRFTSHMTAVTRVLQYLKSTADFRLHFDRNDIGNSLVGYSDSDCADDSADDKSQGGHAFLASNGAISWQSRK